MEVRELTQNQLLAAAIAWPRERTFCSYISLSERTVSRVLWKNVGLRTDDPRGTVPRRCVESGPQVEEEDSGDASRGKRLGNSLCCS
jgi:hypothetical protein